jgi:hypothetical protein
MIRAEESSTQWQGEWSWLCRQLLRLDVRKCGDSTEGPIETDPSSDANFVCRTFRPVKKKNSAAEGKKFEGIWALETLFLLFCLCEWKNNNISFGWYHSH